DLAVGETTGDQGQHLDLAAGQLRLLRPPRRRALGAGAGPGHRRDASLDAERAEPGAEDGLGVAEPGEVVGAVEGDEARLRQLGGELPPKLERDRPVFTAVDDDRGRRNGAEAGGDVEPVDGLERASRLLGARRLALEGDELLALPTVGPRHEDV